MKKFAMISLALAFVLSLFSLTGCKEDPITPDKTYIGSGHPAWAPIMYQQDDKIVGAGPEIVSKIMAELGLDIDIKYTGTWDEVQLNAKSGEVDLIVAAYKTPEREAYMDYSIPYTVDPVSIFVKKGYSFDFTDWNTLIGKKGIVAKGDSYGAEFDAFIKDKLTVVEANNLNDAFTLLTADEADYFVYGLYSGKGYLTSHPLFPIQILPKYVTSENFYITISKKSALKNYMTQINQILEKYKNDATIDNIIKKY